MTSWRSLQPNQTPCEQDLIIRDLFKDSTVRYQGLDQEFASTLNLDDRSGNLILSVNHPVWVSELINLVESALNSSYEKIYVGINRYYIKGNDTDIVSNDASSGKNIIDLINRLAHKHQWRMIRHGYVDNDRGRHLNFVQPVTWAYCEKNLL